MLILYEEVINSTICNFNAKQFKKTINNGTIGLNPREGGQGGTWLEMVLNMDKY